jgi:hypothetical protein
MSVSYNIGRPDEVEVKATTLANHCEQVMQFNGQSNEVHFTYEVFVRLVRYYLDNVDIVPNVDPRIGLVGFCRGLSSEMALVENGNWVTSRQPKHRFVLQTSDGVDDTVSAIANEHGVTITFAMPNTTITFFWFAELIRYVLLTPIAHSNTEIRELIEKVAESRRISGRNYGLERIVLGGEAVPNPQRARAFTGWRKWSCIGAAIVMALGIGVWLAAGFRGSVAGSQYCDGMGCN